MATVGRNMYFYLHKASTIIHTLVVSLTVHTPSNGNRDLVSGYPPSLSLTIYIYIYIYISIDIPSDIYWLTHTSIDTVQNKPIVCK